MKAIDFSRIRLSPKDRTELATVVLSWRSVWSTIKTMPDDADSIEKLAKMLAFEARNPNGPRVQIISRLHGRINGMRQRIEMHGAMRLAGLENEDESAGSVKSKPVAKKH